MWARITAGFWWSVGAVLGLGAVCAVVVGVIALAVWIGTGGAGK